MQLDDVKADRFGNRTALRRRGVCKDPDDAGASAQARDNCLRLLHGNPPRTPLRKDESEIVRAKSFGGNGKIRVVNAANLDLRTLFHKLSEDE